MDLPPFTKVRLPIAVANAQPEVKERALHTTMKEGGHGAVREVVRLILTAQGKISEALAHWNIS